MVAPSINTLKPTTTIKLLCSYGGRILPRYPDGKLRYHGGETRVLSIDRSISYAELVGKLVGMCGTSSTSLRCQLPMEDLDALVSITSDEDLANLIEEHDRVAMVEPPTSTKIRAFLSFPTTTKKVSSPPPSTASSSSSFSSSSSNDATLPTSFYSAITVASQLPTSNTRPCNIRYVSRPPVHPPYKGVATAGKLPKQAYYRHVHVNNNGDVYLIHNGNHWQ